MNFLLYLVKFYIKYVDVGLRNYYIGGGISYLLIIKKYFDKDLD